MTKKRFETSFRPHIFVLLNYSFFFVCVFGFFLALVYSLTTVFGSIRVDTEKSETWDLRVRKTYYTIRESKKKGRLYIGTRSFAIFALSSSHTLCVLCHLIKNQ